MSSLSCCLNRLQHFALRMGANLAGFFWIVGNFAQLLGGALTLAPHILASSALTIASSASSLFFGHKDWGVTVTCVLGILGTGLFLFPDLLAGNSAIIGGYALYCSACTLGLISGHLAAHFQAAPQHWLRHSLGRPRRMMGLIQLASRAPILLSAFLAQDWIIFAPFAFWALGDFCFSLSGEEATKRHLIKTQAHA